MLTPDDEKRSHYRIRYPRAARPSLWLGTAYYQVTELSERGCRMIMATPAGGETAVEAKLRLYCGAVRDITGEIHRIGDTETVLRDLAGISFRDMLEEQRALVRDFPAFK